MSGGSDCCILVPTTSCYESIARFTARQIGELWERAPPLYFCGVAGIDDERWHPLADDPRDWIGIVRTAVQNLQRHYRYCYLVLDDHPPLWRCNERFLNTQLPELMEELQGAYLGLNGWGLGRSGRKPGGEILGRRYFLTEKVDDRFRWKFSLHPALWRLDALEAVLDACAEGKDPAARTAWYFERRAGAADIQIPEMIRAGAYRVCGRVTTASRSRYAAERTLRFGVRASARAFDLVGLFALAAKWKEIGNAMDQYYEGPYPLFWSGVMQKGSLNSDLLVYLNVHGRRRYKQRLLRAVEGSADTESTSKRRAMV